MRVLLVKLSSLGDVVHTLPGLSDAVSALGAERIRFDWVVEEAFQTVAARHPAVADVIPVAWRRWRRAFGSSIPEMRAFLGRLRRRRYDLVLDAQGLLKSAAVTALARATLSAGLSRQSAREGAAAVCYRRRVAVPWGGHAVERIRALFAGALEYPLPAGAPDFGIAGAARSSVVEGPPRCLLLHGSSWPSKLWPVPFWQALARRAGAAGFEVLIPWSGEHEQRRASAIAAGAPARLLPPLGLGELADELSRAALVIGVDSGLAHLAAALAVPTVVVYGSTSAACTGALGVRARNVEAGFACSPCLSRTCSYAGPAASWHGEPVAPACYATVGPDTVWRAARQLVACGRDADRLLHL